MYTPPVFASEPVYKCYKEKKKAQNGLLEGLPSILSITQKTTIKKHLSNSFNQAGREVWVLCAPKATGI